ncbi:hypothetical protein VW35_16395 [Devosia soli]|uniref:histidine kinase n=1 Tax=Devosia soli TaxID=361041 RepID=A0A0F5L3G4_9HYPH|nr:hypothetical protein VW35_16395 [Devosia soli]
MQAAEWLRNRPIQAYAIALLAFLIALWLRFTVDHALPVGFPYLTFFPAVLLTAFFCGTGPGIVVAVLSVVSAWYWFIPPIASFELTSQSAIAVLFFVAILTADIFIIHVMHGALRRLVQEQARTAGLLEQQKTLFAELQHRTANNIAFISALLSMHKRKARGQADPVSVFDDATSRLESMARIHRRLYDPTNGDLQLDAYLAELVRDIFDSAGRERVDVSIVSRIEKLDVNRLITLSLVVSELATNALKHAFSNGTGRFAIELTPRGGSNVLRVRDNGPGFPHGFDPSGSDRLGFRVLYSFARNLNGTLDFRSDDGALVELVFPSNHQDKAA